MTIRQQLIMAVIGRLGAITSANGYATDAGLRVTHFRDLVSEPFQDNELECFCVRDVQELAAAISAAVHEFTLNVELYGLAAAGEFTADRLYALRGDLFKAVSVDPLFGGLAFYCQPTATELDVERFGRRAGVAKVLLELRYRTPPWNPFVVFTPPA